MRRGHTELQQTRQTTFKKKKKSISVARMSFWCHFLGKIAHTLRRYYSCVRLEWLSWRSHLTGLYVVLKLFSSHSGTCVKETLTISHWRIAFDVALPSVKYREDEEFPAEEQHSISLAWWLQDAGTINDRQRTTQGHQ